MKYFSFSAFNTLRSICARLPCFIPEAILLIGCQALLGCGCVAKLLSVNTAQRAHDWASSILIYTHTHTRAQTSLDQTLVMVWWLLDGSTLLPAILPSLAPQTHTCLHGSLCQSDDSVRCAITPKSPPPTTTPGQSSRMGARL